MLEQLKYKNHLNEIFEFGKDGIFVDINDLHDYSWQADTKGKRITGFSRSVQTRKLPVIIICETEAKGISAKNMLHEIAEKDILAMKPGRVIVGNYYFSCYITASQKSDYLYAKRYIKADLTLTSDQPYWVKESTASFGGGAEDTEDGHGYNYNFPYNYASGTADTELINKSFVASNFKLIIYGAVVNPSIIIAGHTYQVNCTVESGSYLTIDSVSKKIYLTANDGTVTNVFSSRNRESYIFEKIPSGRNTVVWSGSFAFDIILQEERSEPKWT